MLQEWETISNMARKTTLNKGTKNLVQQLFAIFQLLCRILQSLQIKCLIKADAHCRSISIYQLINQSREITGGDLIFQRSFEKIQGPQSPQQQILSSQFNQVIFLMIILTKLEKQMHELISYKRIMIPGSMVRRESQSKGLSVQQKKQMAKMLLMVVQNEEMFNISHTLFGYTLATLNLNLTDRFVFDIKKKFSILQELFLARAMEREAISLITVDGIQTYRRAAGKAQDKGAAMLQAFNFDIEEMMSDSRFVVDKWLRLERVDEESRENELAFKKFLEEEAAENKRKAQQADGEGWECPICICEIDKSNFGILECSHIFHPQCVTSYLKSKIEEGQTKIICPMQGCECPLEVGDIYQFCDPVLRQKFQKFTFNQFVEKSGVASWCPTAGCSAVFQFDEELDNYKCPACNKHYCLKCKSIYHTGMTCAEYKINNTFDKGDEDFIKFVKGASFKMCPKCNYWVERADGCSTMTCKCGQQFCYVCGGTTCPHGMCANPPQGYKGPEAGGMRIFAPPPRIMMPRPVNPPKRKKGR